MNHTHGDATFWMAQKQPTCSRHLRYYKDLGPMPWNSIPWKSLLNPDRVTIFHSHHGLVLNSSMVREMAATPEGLALAEVLAREEKAVAAAQAAAARAAAVRAQKKAAAERKAAAAVAAADKQLYMAAAAAAGMKGEMGADDLLRGDATEGKDPKGTAAAGRQVQDKADTREDKQNSGEKLDPAEAGTGEEDKAEVEKDAAGAGEGAGAGAGEGTGAKAAEGAAGGGTATGAGAAEGAAEAEGAGAAEADMPGNPTDEGAAAGTGTGAGTAEGAAAAGGAGVEAGVASEAEREAEPEAQPPPPPEPDNGVRFDDKQCAYILHFVNLFRTRRGVDDAQAVTSNWRDIEHGVQDCEAGHEKEIHENLKRIIQTSRR